MEQRILALLAPAIIESNFSDLSSNQTPGGRGTVFPNSPVLFCRVFPTLLPSYYGVPIIRLAFLYD